MAFVNPEVSKHMAQIGARGGRKHKPGSDAMRELASLSWSPRARAKRLRSMRHAKPRKQPEINSNKVIA